MSRKDERTRLIATAVNNIGVATIAAGFILPEITFPGTNPNMSIYQPYIALAVGVALIGMAQFILGALDE